MSTSVLALRKNFLHLYRASLRTAPQILPSYDMYLRKPQIYQVIRFQFTKMPPVNDRYVLETLLHQGQQELREFSSRWKTKMNIMRFFQEYDQAMANPNQINNL